MPTGFAYTIAYSTEDREYIAKCAEFPSLSWVHVDAVEALRGLMSLVNNTVIEMNRAEPCENLEP